jgi:hypothetical protein
MFMLIHTIRLQGPWELTRSGNDSPQRIQVPCAWRSLQGDACATVVFSRNFNSPTNLASDDTLSIQLPEDAGEILAVRLNGTVLLPVPGSSGGYAISEPLQPFNRLSIELTCNPAEVPEDRGGLWQPVLLRICSAGTSD